MRKIINAIKETAESYELSVPGQSCRWLWQDAKEKRQLGVNEYGYADATNILYTINEFFCVSDTRTAGIESFVRLFPAK